jgi:molybdate transport system regulatory protein
MKSTHKVIKRATRLPTTPMRRAAFSPRCKVWLEQGGKIVLSDWRIELLEAIEETGSLTTAAKQLDVPYRTAWYKLKEVEDRLGIKLLATQSGGTEGGGSQLTTEGREIIRRFHRVTDGMTQLVKQRFQQEFRDGRFIKVSNSPE